jgi:iron donor protein CyaY
MDNALYHRAADLFLNHLADQLEEADAAGQLDVELEADALAIHLPGGKQLLISKHGVSRQLWLSSPLSGGLHFSLAGNDWQLADGRCLTDILSSELEALAHVCIRFEG